MSVTVEGGTTLTFDRFWKFLKEHPNCVLRAGTPECWIFDLEQVHWHFGEDEQRRPLVEVIWGKNLVAEMTIDTRDVMFIQATPAEGEEPGRFLFEVMGDSGGEVIPIYHFLLAHGLAEEATHGGFKH